MFIKNKSIKTILFILLMCTIYWGWNQSRITPKEKRVPEPFFIVHGHFPFSEGYKLTITSKYKSRNKDCQKVYYAIWPIKSATVDIMWGVNAKIERYPDDSNKFSTVIYKDQLLPGYCDWEFVSVSSSIVKIDSELDKHIVTNNYYRRFGAAFILAQKEIQWAELKNGDIKYHCKKEQNEMYDGAFSCSRYDQSELFKMYRSRKLEHEPPMIVNVQYIIKD